MKVTNLNGLIFLGDQLDESSIGKESMMYAISKHVFINNSTKSKLHGFFFSLINLKFSNFFRRGYRSAVILFWPKDNMRGPWHQKHLTETFMNEVLTIQP